MSETPIPPRPAGYDFMIAALHRVGPLVAAADAVGEREDVGDMYHLLDGLCGLVAQVLPEVPCARGCSHCCNAHVFRVTAREWDAARRGLMKWPAAHREAVIAAARAQYGPFRETMVTLADHWSRGERAPAALYNGLPGRCPLLDHAGKCGIYEDRPAICRAYGYFSARVAEEPSLLICRQFGPAWVETLEAAGAGPMPMPNWNPVQRRLEELSAGERIQPLPLWILEDPGF